MWWGNEGGDDKRERERQDLTERGEKGSKQLKARAGGGDATGRRATAANDKSPSGAAFSLTAVCLLLSLGWKGVRGSECALRSWGWGLKGKEDEARREQVSGTGRGRQSDAR